MFLKKYVNLLNFICNLNLDPYTSALCEKWLWYKPKTGLKVVVTHKISFGKRGSDMVRRGSVIVRHGSVMVRRVSIMVWRGSVMVWRGSVMVRRGSVMVQPGSVMVRRGLVMVRGGSFGSTSACCKSGPSSILGSAPQGGFSH
jgi:hypothetical protein